MGPEEVDNRRPATAGQSRKAKGPGLVVGLLEGVGIALEALWANKLRSFLTVLGNIIAVSSIILVVSIIQGLDAEVTDIFTSEGTDVFTLRRRGMIFSEEMERETRSNPRLTRADARMLREEGENFAAVVEGSDRGANVEYLSDIRMFHH